MLDAHLPLKDAGVIHQRGDRPKPSINLLEQPDYIVLDRHIGLKRERAPASCRDAGDERLRGVLAIAIGDADGEAALGGDLSSGSANPAAAAGDQDAF